MYNTEMFIITVKMYIDGFRSEVNYSEFLKHKKLLIKSMTSQNMKVAFLKLVYTLLITPALPLYVCYPGNTNYTLENDTKSLNVKQ